MTLFLLPDACVKYGLPLPPEYKIDRDVWIPHDSPTVVYIEAKRGHYRLLRVRDDIPGKWVDWPDTDAPNYMLTVYMRHTRPCFLAVAHGYDIPEFTMFRHYAHTPRPEVSAPSRRHIITH